MELIHYLVIASISVTLIFGIITLRRSTRKDDREEGKWQGKIEGQISTIEGQIKAMTHRVDAIFHRIFFGKVSDEFFASSSPVDLTERGQKIADELEMENLTSTFIPLIVPRLEKHEPYAVEQTCMNYAIDELEGKLQETAPETLESMMRVAYENGIPKEAVFRIFGIVLRKMVLKHLQLS